MENISEFVSTNFGINQPSQHKILLSLLILFFLWIIKLGILRFVWKQTKNIKIRYNWKRSLSLTIRYLCNPRKRRSSENDIWEDIVTAFHAETDIRFAYPTTRFYSAREVEN